MAPIIESLPMKVKLHGWNVQLHDTIELHRNHPFIWGWWDCALSCAAYVEAQTGEDLGIEFRGEYDSAIGAARRLIELGYGDLQGLFQAKFQEIHPAFAQVGDLGLCRSTETGWAAGVFLGEHVGMLSPQGYGVTDRSIMEYAYRISLDE